MKDNSWMSYMNKTSNQVKNGKNQSVKGNSKGNAASAKQMNRRSQ